MKQTYKPRLEDFLVLECVAQLSGKSAPRQMSLRGTPDTGAERRNSAMVMSACDALLEGHPMVFTLEVRSPQDHMSVDLGVSQSLQRVFELLREEQYLATPTRSWAQPHRLTLRGEELLSKLRRLPNPISEAPRSEWALGISREPRVPKRHLDEIIASRTEFCMLASFEEMRRAWVDMAGDLMEIAARSSLFQFHHWYDPFRPSEAVALRIQGRSQTPRV